MLAESSGYISLCALVFGVCEDLVGVVVLDEVPGAVFAHHEEGGLVRDAGGLLHIVGDYDYGIAFFELAHQVLDSQRGDWVQRGGGFVHENDFRLDRNGASDAQTLLLAAGQCKRAVAQAIFHFVPEGGLPEGTLHCLVHVALITVYLEPEGHVVVDGLGERVRTLEHHADAGANLCGVNRIGVEVGFLEEDFAFDSGARDEIVHAVEAAQQSALSTAGRPDESRNRVSVDGHVYVSESAEGLVVEAEVIDLENWRRVVHATPPTWFGTCF